MGRRACLYRTISALAVSGLILPEAVRGQSLAAELYVGERGWRRQAQGTSRQVQIPATLQAGAFTSSSGDDARYHALVYEGGGAAEKALLTTPVSDLEELLIGLLEDEIDVESAWAAQSRRAGGHGLPKRLSEPRKDDLGAL